MSKDKTGPLRRYYELLQLYGDYLRTGFAAEHESIEIIKTDESDARRRALEDLADKIRNCHLCPLCHNRLNAVPGEGAFDPLVMVVGEGPGADEDLSGRPFVGAAGQYLDKWLKSIMVERGRNGFIANVVKCRPPENRDPRPEEVAACLPYLKEQISLTRPRLILCVGRVASQTLLGEERGIGSLRGGSYFFEGIPLVPTYHPSAVLRDQGLRPAVWEDLKRLKALFTHA